MRPSTCWSLRSLGSFGLLGRLLEDHWKTTGQHKRVLRPLGNTRTPSLEVHLVSLAFHLAAREDARKLPEDPSNPNDPCDPSDPSDPSDTSDPNDPRDRRSNPSDPPLPRCRARGGLRFPETCEARTWHWALTLSTFYPEVLHLSRNLNTCHLFSFPLCSSLLFSSLLFSSPSALVYSFRSHLLCHYS